MDRLDVIFYLEQVKHPFQSKSLHLMGMGKDPGELVLQCQAIDAAISDVTLLEKMKEKTLSVEKAEEYASALADLQEKVVTLQAVAGLTIERITERLLKGWTLTPPAEGEK